VPRRVSSSAAATCKCTTSHCCCSATHALEQPGSIMPAEPSLLSLAVQLHICRMHWLSQTATIKNTHNDMQPASGTIQQLQNIGVAMSKCRYHCRGEPTCCSRDLKALAAGPSAPSSLLSQLVCTAIASNISKHKHAKHVDGTTNCTLPHSHVCNGNYQVQQLRQDWPNMQPKSVMCVFCMSEQALSKSIPWHCHCCQRLTQHLRLPARCKPLCYQHPMRDKSGCSHN